MPSKQVKPCRVCKSNEVAIRPIIGPHGGAGGDWQVFCTNCGATALSPQARGRDGAISYWNNPRNWR